MINPLEGGGVLIVGENNSFNTFCASVTDDGGVADGKVLAECKGPRTRGRPKKAFCCCRLVYSSSMLILHVNTHD